MANVTLSLSCDSGKLLEDLQLLAKSAKCSHQVRKRLFDLGDLGPELICSDIDNTATATAGELRIHFCLGNSLLELVAAIRAGEFDGSVVE